MQFHNKLFQLRKKTGMTQAELAEAVNVLGKLYLNGKWERLFLMLRI